MQTHKLTDEEYKSAVVQAVGAAEGKAHNAKEGCPHVPITHASQKALERSDLTGMKFDRAYDEVYQNTYYAVKSDEETAKVLTRIYNKVARSYF